MERHTDGGVAICSNNLQILLMLRTMLKTNREESGCEPHAVRADDLTQVSKRALRWTPGPASLRDVL